MTVTLTLSCQQTGTSHTFGPEGGTLGRSQRCDWVLPDGERILSSIHARVICQGGVYYLVDESTNGTFLAGVETPIGRGQSVQIGQTTNFQIGRYLITAHLKAAEPAPAPPPPPPLTATQTHQSPPHTQRPPSSRIDAQLSPNSDTSGAAVRTKQSLDPLDYLSGGLTKLSQPQARPIASRAGYSPAPGATADPMAYLDRTGDQPAPSAPQNPEFEHPATSLPPQVEPVRAPVAAPAPASPVYSEPQTSLPAGRPQAGQTPYSQAPNALPHKPQSAEPAPAQEVIPVDFLDQLMGGDLAAAAPSRAPTTPSPATQAPPPPPTNAVLNGDQGLSPALKADHIEILTPQSAKEPQPDRPVPAMTPRAAPTGGADPIDHLAALKARRERRLAELDEKAKLSAPGVRPPARPAANPPTPPLPTPPIGRSQTPPTGPVASQAGATATASAPQRPAPPPTPSSPSFPKDDEQLTHAFLVGLGFPDAKVGAEKRAALMEEAGGMIRELAQGMVVLLSARKMLKSEFRMDETQIAPEENNPFKHFKVGELAIDEMLLTKSGGFQKPDQATRQAFQDLQAHTMITMAAMQRAMRIMFERLSPDMLAEDDEDAGGLRIRGLGAKKGKWETAKQNYSRIRSDFDGVMRQIIMEAFAQTEEEQARRQSRDYWENRKK